MGTQVIAARTYRTGFCGVGLHAVCPAIVRCRDDLIVTCTCTCHSSETSVAAGDAPALRPPAGLVIR